MNWQEHNQRTSAFTRKLAFLQRKLDQHQHAPYHARSRRHHERMANHYRAELARLGVHTVEPVRLGI